MPNFKSWILTNATADHWLDSFAVSSTDLGQRLPTPWSIRKQTLRGGLRDGVDLVEVDNGGLSFSILPTRGMGLWRGQYQGLRLGWQSPVPGPVHPKFVNLLDRGGLGWLAGFDEWICRCGLSSNGPPGHDPGQGGGELLPLHGRIANLPAHRVEVQVDLDPPHELRVIGQLDEAALFFPNLRLTSTIRTTPGGNRLTITDEIENRATKPAELELLYHCQFSPPFLEAGSRMRAPIHTLAPRNARAAEGIARHDLYEGPTPGFVEQVYFYDLLADSQGRTLALLHDAKADKGVVLRFEKSELPRFVVWKNSAAVEDGYVTGLEPATNFPNFKSFERDHGRVITLPPGARKTCSVSIEVHASASEVAGVLKEIEMLQKQAKPIIHSQPIADWCQ
jgi:hypothetical protein